jgi:four helix bundle protein
MARGATYSTQRASTRAEVASDPHDPFGDAYTFRKLAMWQRAQELTNEVLDIVSRLPETQAARIIGTQLVRSSSSIAANIAEGHGRFASGAYRNHLSIARGSTAETIGWIDLLVRRRWISHEHESSAMSKCAELMKMLTAKMNQLKTSNTRSTLRDEGETDYEI